MECAANIDTIQDAFLFIRKTSYDEKRDGINTEEQINKFLDRILELQKYLNTKSDKLEEINNKLEGLSWLNDLKESHLLSINDLIASAKDLHSILIRQYVNLNYLRSKGVAKESIKRFKQVIDDLKENIADIESIFFFLPKVPEFVETTRQLSLIK